MKRTGKKSSYDNWDKNLPVLLVSGQDDPVGNFGKSVVKVKKTMEKAGIKNVKMHLINDARHDLLHEECSGCAKKVREFLKDWITQLTL